MPCGGYAGGSSMPQSFWPIRLYWSTLATPVRAWMRTVPKNCSLAEGGAFCTAPAWRDLQKAFGPKVRSKPPGPKVPA